MDSVVCNLIPMISIEPTVRGNVATIVAILALTGGSVEIIGTYPRSLKRKPPTLIASHLYDDSWRNTNSGSNQKHVVCSVFFMGMSCPFLQWYLYKAFYNIYVSSKYPRDILTVAKLEINIKDRIVIRLPRVRSFRWTTLINRNQPVFSGSILGAHRIIDSGFKDIYVYKYIYITYMDTLIL